MFSRREKALLAAAVIAVAAALGMQFAHVREAAGEQRSNVEQWRALKHRVSALEQRLAAITSKEGEVLPSLLRATQASSAATRVSVISIRPRRAKRTASGCIEHGVEVQARGHFPDLVRFMFDLEQNNPRIRLASVSISAIDGTSDTVNSTITVVGYSPGEVQK